MLAAEVEPISSTQMGASDCSVRDTAPSPLERRVRRCAMDTGLAPWAGMVEVPRKSFMKLCVTDAMRQFRASGSIDSRNLNIARARLLEPAKNSIAWLRGYLPPLRSWPPPEVRPGSQIPDLAWRLLSGFPPCP